MGAPVDRPAGDGQRATDTDDDERAAAREEEAAVASLELEHADAADEVTREQLDRTESGTDG